jgi:flavin-dependent dehydrogenase
LSIVERDHVETDADVVVIGGGPGGTAAAITAAAGGLRVVVLESKVFPRPRPGETLHPGVEPVLVRLGLQPSALTDAGCLRHSGVWIERSGGRHFEPYGRDATGDWLGFQAPRKQLDRLLLEQAAGLGVRIWQPCRVRDILGRSGKGLALGTDRGVLRARWVVDAGGGRHFLARRLGMRIRYRSRPLVARYGYAVGRCVRFDVAPTFRVERDGWTWAARIGADRYHWTRLSLVGKPDDSRDPPAALASLELEPARGENVTWRHAERFAGDGFFLVGDAAGVLDPASSKGVLRALLAGIGAGNGMARSHVGRIPSATVAHHYDSWMRSWFDTEIGRLAAWYKEAGFA